MGSTPIRMTALPGDLLPSRMRPWIVPVFPCIDSAATTKPLVSRIRMSVRPELIGIRWIPVLLMAVLARLIDGVAGTHNAFGVTVIHGLEGNRSRIMQAQGEPSPRVSVLID